MKRIIIILIATSLWSCKKETAASEPLPKAVATYERDGIRVPSYDFKAFEPYLKRSNDTTYVINFWATWCQPCVEELPNFEKLASQSQDKKIKVILVSLDMKKQVESALIPFIQKNKLQAKVIHLSDPDANAWIPKVSPEWSGALPATVIYNHKKRQFYERSFTLADLQKELTTFNIQ